MQTRLEVHAVHDILMKTWPFLKSILSLLLIVLGIPLKHLRAVLNAYALAVGLNDAVWVIQ